MKKNDVTKIAAFILVCTVIVFLGLYLNINNSEQNASPVTVSTRPTEQMATEKLIQKEKITSAPRFTETSHDHEMMPSTPRIPESFASVESGDKTLPDFHHLRLLVIATDAENKLLAIISNELTGRQDIFRTGDEIEKATIVEINRDQTILEYEGKFFPLMLEKSESIQSETLTEPISANESQPVLGYVDQAEIERAWEETQELMTKIEVDQHLEQEQPKGVIVSRVTPGSVFEEIGLKPGDVIIKVDGMEMNIADDAMEIYNCLRTRESVTFTVIRQGEPSPVPLTYTR